MLEKYVAIYTSARGRKASVQGEFSMAQLSIWGCILNAVLEVVGPGSILLSNYIDGLDEGIKTVLIKFAGGTKLGGVVIALQDRNKIQNGLDSLRKWLYKIGINFNRDSVKWHRSPHSPRTVP